MAEHPDERSPLLQFPGSGPVSFAAQDLPDSYKQFCHLIGKRAIEDPENPPYRPARDALYNRAVHHRKVQGRIYMFTSALTNTLLLSQIILGAALTGLGASDSSRLLITCFGALNTVIAGLVAFLKSRGQPMRARMFRDDLARVVDEIENSATMWRGISQNIHGYDAIDTDEEVTVRSEVARLTRLYDRAVKTNTMNNPDFYGAGVTMDSANSGLRSRTGQTTLLPTTQPQVPTAAGPSEPPAGPDSAHPAVDPDESPATRPPAHVPKDEAAADPPVEAVPVVEAGPQADAGAKPAASGDASNSTPTATPAPASAPAPAPAPASISTPAVSALSPGPLPPPTPSVPFSAPVDPDASPATASRPPPHLSDRSKAKGSKVTEDLSPNASSQSVSGGAAK